MFSSPTGTLIGLGLTLLFSFFSIGALALIAWRGSQRAKVYLGRAAGAEAALSVTERELERLRAAHGAAGVQLSSVREAAAAQAAQLEEARHQLVLERAAASQQAAQLREAFQAIAGETLRGATDHFKRLAEGELRSLIEKSDGNAAQRQQAVSEIVAPLRDALGRLAEEQRRISEVRAGETAALSAELQGFRLRSDQLSAETHKLTTALRTPHVRGRWGEIQLRRTVELAGMSAHCDFAEQATVRSDDGVRRPDLVIHLPRGRQVVIDSKVPFTHYLEAAEASSDEAREEALRRHAQLVRTHVGQLTEKRYWEQFDGADFVVLFLPNEGLLSAAIEREPDLLERAAESRVLLATPTSLIALLRVIAVGWREERLAQNAEAIAMLGRELYDRLVKLSDHLTEVGEGLRRTVRAYNRTVGSLQVRVLPQARRFQELDAASERELEDPPLVDEVARELN